MEAWLEGYSGPTNAGGVSGLGADVCWRCEGFAWLVLAICWIELCGLGCGHIGKNSVLVPVELGYRLKKHVFL